jgi:hypothetical protein
MKLFRTISAILLATLVLVSSTSFMVGFHICMGEVQNVSIFSKADECAMEKNLPPCHRKMQEPCCDDETFVHEGDDFKASVEQIHIAGPALTYIEHSLVVLAEVIPSAPSARVPFHNYDPPLRSCDRTVAHQSFLI